MFKIFFDILKVFFDFLKLPLFIFLSFVGVITLLTLVDIVKEYIKGKRLKKAEYRSNYKKSGVFKRIFVELPKMLSYDFYEGNPDTFKEHGLIVFTGRQGKGKTISLVEYLNSLKAQYLALKVITNLDYAKQDDELVHWKQLIEYNNGHLGVAVGIDETQNWFSSADSKYFPPAMLEVITQNRKNRRVIVGTSQSFYLLSKAIRTQCTEVRECHTFLHCITFVFRKEPILDFEGNIMEMKNRGMYFFVHTPQLREDYDTYKAISRLSKTGFNEKENLYT